VAIILVPFGLLSVRFFIQDEHLCKIYFDDYKRKHPIDIVFSMKYML
jgi:hypothetical protein